MASGIDSWSLSRCSNLRRQLVAQIGWSRRTPRKGFRFGPAGCGPEEVQEAKVEEEAEEVQEAGAEAARLSDGSRVLIPMTGPPKQITGRCLCGGVTYSAEAEPIVQAVCHCTDCQRQTGSPFTVFVGVPRSAFKVEGDTIASFATTGVDHGGDTQRHFCSTCGSPIFSFSPLAPDVALIKAGSLDDSSWVEPAAEFWTSSAQTWSPHFEQAVQIERGPQ
jgi:hypothetical protein